MRLNKMRLAAAMMSAVMAASTMSTAVFAEELDLIVDEGVISVVEEGVPAEEVVSTEEIVEDQVELAATLMSIYVDSEGKAYKRYSDGVGDVRAEDLDGDVKPSVIDQDCTHAKTLVYEISYKNQDYRWEYPDKNYPVLGHNLTGEAKWVVDVPATCTKDGSGHMVKKCLRCGEDIDVPGSTENIAATGKHNFVETKTEYCATATENLPGGVTDANITVKNGYPELVDTGKAGYYDIVVSEKCETCEQWIVNAEKTKRAQKLTETARVFKNAVVTYVANVEKYVGEINEFSEGKELTKEEYGKLDPMDFVLTDCSKVGRYTVIINYTNGTFSSSTIEVPIHHTAGDPVIAGKTAADEKLLQENYDEDHKLVSVVSKSCYKSATYTETVKCLSPVCSLKNKVISQEEKVAKPAGAHIATTAAENALSALKTATANGASLTQNAYEAFLNVAQDEDNGIKYASSIECGVGGSVVVTLLCKECGQEITSTTAEFKVGKLEHKAGAAKQENVVKATCAAKGSYDLVTRCQYCDEVLNTIKVSVDALEHTISKDTKLQVAFRGDKVVDKSGNFLTKKGQSVSFAGAGTVNAAEYGVDYGVYAESFAYCDVCGQEAKVQKLQSIKIVDIQKEDGKGNAGSITLEAKVTRNDIGGSTQTVTLEQTFPYFSSWLAYMDRNSDVLPNNGLVLDKDGKYRYYKDGKLQEDYTGLLTLDDGRMFYITKGELNNTVEGLQLIDGTWYFFALGQVQTQYTGLALYDGEWFYLTKGILDTTVNGLVPYNGKTFLFADGRLVDEYTGLWFNTKNIGGDDEWYYITNGWVRDDYTGSTVYDGVTFQVVNGKLAK